MESKIEDILKEIEHMLEKANDLLEITENKDKDMHLMALGKVMALNDLKYSINHDNWLYKNHKKESE